MITEILVILAILLGGSALMHSTGIYGWHLPALGFIAGLSLMVIIGSLQAFMGLNTNPVITLLLLICLPFAVWLKNLIKGADLKVGWRHVILVIAVTIGLVILFRELHMFNWSTDSFRYLMTGNLLANNNYYSATYDLLTKRLLAVPLIHAPANLYGEHYLRSFSPLLAISTVIFFYWSFKMGLGSNQSNKNYQFFLFGGILLLLTNNRFIFNVFYINGHLLFATLLLTIAACNWLLVKSSEVPVKALFTIQALAVPVLIVTRPEGFIIAGLTLLPFIISQKIPAKHRALIALIYGISVAAWHLFIIIIFMQRGYEIPLYSSAPLVLGFFIILGLPLLYWRYFEHFSRYLLVFMEIGLWLALLAFTIIQPDILYRSINATIENIIFGAGSWGLSLIIIALFTCGVLLFTDAPDRLFLRFPLTTFIPVAFLLAYFREGAYRVGDGDSLNRSLIHIVPLAILLIVSAVESEYWVLPEWIKTFGKRFMAPIKRKHENK